MNAYELVALAKELMLGKRSKKMTAPVIEAALADLQAEREHAHNSAAELAERRRTALLDGLDDAEIEAIEAQERALDRKLERLDLAEPELRKRLDEARSEARRELFKRNAGYLKESRARYLDLARQTAKAARDFVELRYRVGDDFREVLLLPLVPMVGDSFVIQETSLAAWEAESERFFDVLPPVDQARGTPWDGADQPSRTLDYSAHNRAPAPILAATKTKKQPKAPAHLPDDDRTFRTVAIANRSAAPAEEREPALPRLLAEPELKAGDDGLVAVDFLRTYEDAGGALQPGQHRVTPAVAMAAMRSGAADLPAGGQP